MIFSSRVCTGAFLLFATNRILMSNSNRANFPSIFSFSLDFFCLCICLLSFLILCFFLNFFGSLSRPCFSAGIHCWRGKSALVAATRTPPDVQDNIYPTNRSIRFNLSEEFILFLWNLWKWVEGGGNAWNSEWSLSEDLINRKKWKISNSNSYMKMWFQLRNKIHQYEFSVIKV